MHLQPHNRPYTAAMRKSHMNAIENYSQTLYMGISYTPILVLSMRSFFLSKTSLNILFTSAFLFPVPSWSADAPTPAAVVGDYARLVHATYADTVKGAIELQKKVDAFLANPNEKSLAHAREAWIAARRPYARTEAFRFYDGPIDVAKGRPETEAHLNSWPVNEAYIDYVRGNLHSGIVNDLTKPLTRATLTAANQADDEVNVATGYHAVEFLLWGQDFNLNGPGQRPAKDYAGDNEASKRRRTYLKLATDMILEDVRYLEDAWAAGKNNYAHDFTVDNPAVSLGKILTGLATLSVHEMAAERMNDSLMSGDQEDEQDCFSDDTQQDLADVQRGIVNVLNGPKDGTGLIALIATKDKALAVKLRDQAAATQKAIDAIPAPLDAKVLATPEESPGRVAMKHAIDQLLEQGTLVLDAGKALAVPVEIVSDNK